MHWCMDDTIAKLSQTWTKPSLIQNVYFGMIANNLNITFKIRRECLLQWNFQPPVFLLHPHSYTKYNYIHPIVSLYAVYSNTWPSIYSPAIEAGFLLTPPLPPSSLLETSIRVIPCKINTKTEGYIPLQGGLYETSFLSSTQAVTMLISHIGCLWQWCKCVECLSQDLH